MRLDKLEHEGAVRLDAVADRRMYMYCDAYSFYAVVLHVVACIPQNDYSPKSPPAFEKHVDDRTTRSVPPQPLTGIVT